MSRRDPGPVAAFVTAMMLLGGCASDPAAHDAQTRLPVAARADAERQVVVTIEDAHVPRLVAGAGATPRPLGGGTGAYRGSAHAQDVARALARDYQLEWVAAWRIGVLDVHCVVFRVSGAAGRDELLARLRADARVESAQPMQRFSTSAQAEPAGVWNDPYFPLQRSLERMRVPQAQELSTGRQVRVAVIDTGADTRHPDLEDRIVQAVNFVDADAAHFRRDRHGTAVAGAIAAAADNRLGIVGVAPGVQLMLLKACWEDDPSQPATCNSLTLAEALAHAIERGAQVINLSLTGPSDPLLERLVQRAVRAGIVVVAADVARDADAQMPFPLNVPEVLAVADSDQPVSRSAGPRDLRQRLAAPGQEVLTTVPGGRYDFVSGTSMSVALASGVVAMVLELRPAMRAAQLVQLLAATSAFAPPATGALRENAASLDAEHALRTLPGGAVRNTRVAAGTLPCGSAGRSAGCR